MMTKRIMRMTSSKAKDLKGRVMERQTKRTMGIHTIFRSRSVRDQSFLWMEL